MDKMSVENGIFLQNPYSPYKIPPELTVFELHR